MRSLTVYFVAVALLMLLLPLPSLRLNATPSTNKTDRPAHTLTTNTGKTTVSATTTTTAPPTEDRDVFRVQLESGIVEMEAVDFLRYVVTCEMPLSYGEEALKAQAVASYTYFSYQRDKARKAGDKADFSDVPQRFEETCSEEKLKARLGSYYEEYNRKLTKAVQAVLGYTIRYDGALILAAYHASNGGETASSKEVWQVDYPYLQAVPSPSDKTAADGVREQVLTKDEVKAALETLSGVTLGDDPTAWFGEMTRFSSGLIETVSVGNAVKSGLEVRYALGLRSANFTVSYKNELFTFTVVGYGHGVGFSQYGAGAMARQGSTFEEILRHYYTGVTVEKA